jgi:glycerophosphoryl diester phosphodiesterase
MPRDRPGFVDDAPSALVADIRRHGLGIVVWHEERPFELRALARLDVDGICTNRPDVLAAILSEERGER